MKLRNYVSGRWSEGLGTGELLIDPVTGDELASISSQGVDLEAALQFARAHGGPALRQLTYTQRAELLGKIADVLAANREEYFRLSLLNLGATQADASFDVDGAIYTMKYYAKIGRALAEGKMLKEGASIALSKSNAFAGQHFLMPAKGVAVFINALGRDTRQLVPGNGIDKKFSGTQALTPTTGNIVTQLHSRTSVDLFKARESC